MFVFLFGRKFFIFIYFYFITAYGIRTKRQSEETATKKDESFEQELCKGKDAGEWFRLVAGEGDNCRDVIQCTSSVSSLSIISILKEKNNRFTELRTCV